MKNDSLPTELVDATPPEQDGAQELRRVVRRFVKSAIALLAILLFCRTFVCETWPVEGPSMTPTLQENDRVLVFKLPMVLSRLPLLHFFNSLDTGDLLVFETTGPDPQKLIKRVIAEGPSRGAAEVLRAESTADESASPYDVHVLFDHGAVYVNNSRLKEAYLQPEERKSADRDQRQLKPGQYYVLGDHRSVSKDSRRLGPITEDQVIGEAVLCVWPLHRIGWL